MEKTGPIPGPVNSQRRAALVATLAVAQIFEIRIEDIFICATCVWLYFAGLFLAGFIDGLAKFWQLRSRSGCPT
jgi:hypothetical protein